MENPFCRWEFRVAVEEFTPNFTQQNNILVVASNTVMVMLGRVPRRGFPFTWQSDSVLLLGSA